MKRVAIVGMAPSTRDLVPWDDSQLEVWGMNVGYRQNFMVRADRWFDLHSRTLIETNLDIRRPADYIQWLAAFEGPVYMQEAWPDIPNSVRYPLESVIAQAGPYLTSSAAMMLGLAILEDVEEVGIYGLDMSTPGEYIEQRAGFEYLIGFAKGLGMLVRIPDACPLLKAPIYGRGAWNPGGERLTDDQFSERLDHLKKRQAELEAEIVDRQMMLASINGAIAETVYWINRTPEGGRPELVLAGAA